MCGRYVFHSNGNKTTQALRNAAMNRLPLETFNKIAWNDVRPADIALVGVYNGEKRKWLSLPMVWGCHFANQKRLIINARSETLFTSSFFADCSPCSILASGYYEWSPDKTQYLFHTDAPAFYMAGLYRQEGKIMRFVIITEEANDSAQKIHSRQPVILSREDAMQWSKTKDPALIALSNKNRTYEPSEQRIVPLNL